MYNEFVKDLADMEEGCERTVHRCDIWQDRLIYAICRTLFHLLTWAIRIEAKRSRPADTKLLEEAGFEL